MAASKLMQGTKVLTAATLTSKLIGFVYVIPFTALVGLQGNALYQNGYTPYSILLTLSTLGVPVAMSKYVSKYHALGDYETAHRLFKSGIWFMAVTGLLAFLVMFLGAPALASLSYQPSETDQYTFDNVVYVIRMVSFALLIIPIMAIVRGYLQGFQQMVPTSVSQVVEQIVRVVFILAASFAVMSIGSGDLPRAVGFATFGAFVGGIGGMATLLYFYFKQRPTILARVQSHPAKERQTLPSMYKELISYALPLSFVGLAIPFFQAVDLYSIEGALSGTAYASEAKAFVGALTGVAHKIVLIPMALATALSITLVPTITKAYVNQDNKLLQSYITQTYQVILFIGIPAAIGMSVLAKPTYFALFGSTNLELGAETLGFYAPATVFFSIYAVTGSILQGMDRQRNAVLSLVVGLLLKLGLTYVFLKWFGPYGAIWTTYIGFGIGIALNVYFIGRFAKFDYTFIYRRTVLIVIFAAIMGVAVWVFANGLAALFPELSRVTTFIVLLVSIGVGLIVYFYLAIRSHLAGKVLGERFKL